MLDQYSFARWMGAVVLGLLAVGLTGCPQKSAAPTTPPEMQSPVQEVKFQRILKDLRRTIAPDDTSENRDVGLGGSGKAEWSYVLDHELVKPEAGEEGCKAVITITRRSTLTLFNTKDKDDKDSAGEPESEDSLDPSAEGEAEVEAGGMAIPEVPTGVPGGLIAGGSPITTRENEKVRKYELEFVDGKWRLLTKPDPKTESALEAAFKHALARQ